MKTQQIFTCCEFILYIINLKHVSSKLTEFSLDNF